MAARRRPSVRTRLDPNDVSYWVNHNSQQQQLQQQQAPTEENHHVRFAAPPPSSDREDSDDEESLTERPVALDGGYGWFVAFCSFVMHFVADGASFCFGILYSQIQEEFKVDHVDAMLTAALFLSMPLCIAPFAGVISDLFGCRISILSGGLICTLSTIAAMFCSSFKMFTFFFGFSCGFGMGFIYNAAIVIVTYYFDAKLGRATAFAVSGTGTGTFIFPQYLTLVKFLLKNYVTSLRASLVAYALAFFVILLIGWFIRDVTWVSDTKAYKEKIFDKFVKSRTEEDFEAPVVYQEIPLRRALSLPNLERIKVDFGSIQSVCEAKADGKIEVPTRSKSVALFDNNKPRMPQIPEYSMINATLANLEHLDLELANSPCTTVRAQRRRVISKISMSVDQINEIDDEEFKICNLFHSSSSSVSESSSDDSEMSNDGDSSSSELSEKKLPDTASRLLDRTLPPFPARANSSAPTSARLRAPGTTNTSGGRILASNAIQTRWKSNLITMGKIPSCPELVARKKRKSLFKTINPKMCGNLLEQQKPAYKEVLSKGSFRFLMISVTCLYFVLDVPYVCFFDYGTEQLNLSESFSNMIYMAIGFANFAATLLIGRLCDYFSAEERPSRHKYVPTFYIFSMLMVGASIFAAQICRTGVQLLFCGMVFGIFVTSNYVLQSILINRIFEDDRNLFQAAYSTVSVVEGLASFFGPLFFAYIRQASGSYQMVFILSGFMACLSAFFAYLSFRQMLTTPEEDDGEENDVDLEQGTAFNHDAKLRQNGNGKAPENENLLHP